MIKGPFQVQTFSESEEEQVIKNNMTIDFYFGHKKILNKFVNININFKQHYHWLESLDIKKLREEVNKAKKNSMLITLMMLTGRCNANCEICCTDRKYNSNELKRDEIIEILHQVSKLGCKTIYIPGEGEPFYDSSLFDILNVSKKLNMSVIIFTNGTFFSDDDLAKKYWGKNSKELVLSLLDYPVYIYHKLWTFEESLLAKMMRFNIGLYKFTNYKNYTIPKGLVLLLKYFPVERIGIETVIEKRNYNEFFNKILPFVEETNIHAYFEPIVHSGRAFKNYNYDLNSIEFLSVKKYINRLYCKRLGYMIAIHNKAFASFGILFSPEQYLSKNEIEELNIRENGKIKDLFTLMHTNKLLVNGRYEINKCLCEVASNHIANGGNIYDLFENYEKLETY